MFWRGPRAREDREGETVSGQRLLKIQLISTVAVFAAISQTVAQSPTANGGLSNFDIRQQKPVAPGQVRTSSRATLRNIEAARSELKRIVPGARVLSGPDGMVPEVVSMGAAGRFLTAPSKSRPEDVARSFLSTHAGLYGLSSAQMAALVKTADYANPAGNLSWVEFRQVVNGLPVFQGTVRAALSAGNDLAGTTGNLVPGLDAASLAVNPKLSIVAAVISAGTAIGVKAHSPDFFIQTISSDGRTAVTSKGPYLEPVHVELLYFPIGNGAARLAYAVALWDKMNAYYVVVDAEDGTLLFRKNVMAEQTQTATYTIYDDDSPSPQSPSLILPGAGTQPSPIARSTITLISENSVADARGWIADGDNTTTGNNLDCGLDLNGDDSIDAGSRPIGVPPRVFSFSYGPPPGASESPADANYRQGVVTTSKLPNALRLARRT